MGRDRIASDNRKHPKPHNGSWIVQRTPPAPDDACGKGTCDHPEHEQGTVSQ